MDSYNLRYVEERLADYARDPESVSRSWREMFDRLGEHGRLPARPPSGARRSVFNPTVAGNGYARRLDAAQLQDRLDQLVEAYRMRGHLAAKLDPLGMMRHNPPDLSPAAYGISEADLERRCSTLAVGGPDSQTVGEVIDRLRDTYCRYIGIQVMHVDDPAVRRWLEQRVEESGNHIDLPRETQLRILTRLTDAVMFEEFVRKKYVGSKTFSLEGAESLIPLLDLAIDKASRQGVEGVVLGMAHRGRLNVLANIIGKRPQEIFWEFNDPRPDLHRGRGDVKYHLGFSGDWKTQAGNKVDLSLCFNPSHLEFVNPVALGRMRAKQDRAGDADRRRGMVVLIHGDAGFAGEGIVQETLNLSQLPGYTTGGALHVIVNNQLGFTTPPEAGRSTRYPSDVARMLQSPIFHVNGEHPEAVAQAVELAMDFRGEFRRDVVIDMFCYRRWGHNEGDEPGFTQPLMYQAIEHRDSVRAGYLADLLEMDGISRDDADKIARDRRDELSRQFKQAQEEEYQPPDRAQRGVWEEFRGGKEPDDEPVTGVSRDLLCELLQKLATVPDDFHLHKKLKQSVERRQEMADGKELIDWSAAEALAIATLAVEGHPVRLTGQDAARGTFSQRHSILHDVVDGSEYPIFGHLTDDQAPVEIINSPLSEAGALGFEYGYSLDSPEALVAWEAQYGDFANAAQVILDQFLTSAEDKWRRLSGIVLLLPHGFEGQGPEHSSARLERFLNLSAEDNIQVVCPTTPAQYFHVLRRQVKRRWRKPLVVLTPKSLLRHPRVASKLDELVHGRFQRIIWGHSTATIRRVLLCSGKVYYDLSEYQKEHDRTDVAIVRVEQFYPLRKEMVHDILQPLADGADIFWVQEEPVNMGAWWYWRARWGEQMAGRPLKVVARAQSASPATGSKASHKREQQDLVKRAFDRNVAANG